MIKGKWMEANRRRNEKNCMTGRMRGQARRKGGKEKEKEGKGGKGKEGKGGREGKEGRMRLTKGTDSSFHVHLCRCSLEYATSNTSCSDR